MIDLSNAFIIPLTDAPNQSFSCTVPVDSKNIRLRLTIRYNHIAEYWWMTIHDDVTGKMILDSIPLLPGEYPAANILEQYDYLQIGSAFVVPTSDNIVGAIPDDTNLGTDFVLVWSGNIE